ncbi:MAG: rRNA maturation RNase YbeY [Chitinophagaceae bacterium]
MKQKVKFYYADIKNRIKGANSIKQSVEKLFLEENHKLSYINYVFCSDEYLLTINKEHLNHDYYTDIITFDLTDNVNEGIIGEIYVSFDRIVDNAINHQTNTQNELLRVVFHGALHLCGYKDKAKSDELLMRKKENYYIEKHLSLVSHNTVSQRNIR